MRVFASAVVIALALVGCRAKQNRDGESQSLDSGNGAQVIVAVKDASTAASIFDSLKKWDQGKSSASTRIYEGRAELFCSVDGEAQCSMTTGVARDYLFNFGGVNADILNDRWTATPVVGAGISSKTVSGLMRMTASRSEFKVELLGAAPASRAFVTVSNAAQAKGIYDRLKLWDKTQSTATSKVYKGQVEVECQERNNEHQCWMKTAKKEFVFNFSDEHADYITLVWALPAVDVQGVKVKRQAGQVRMVATPSQFLLELAD
jgi:uncharacterized lipoprotein NlpE involved in copper resistance